MSNFKVGDKVRFVGTGDGPRNMVGTVVSIRRSLTIGVYFPEFANMSRGHNCGGFIDSTYGGWWCTPSELKLVEPPKWPPKESRPRKYANMQETLVLPP